MRESTSAESAVTPDFHKLMAEATRLTQAGDLGAATAAIQAALDRRSFAADARAPGRDDDVIDVEAREVPDDDAVALDGPAAREPGPDAPRPAPAAPRPAPAAPRPDPDTRSGFIAGRFGQGRAARDFKLFLPPGRAASPAPALVVMLHGCTQDPDDFARGTGMNELARAHGFLVLYPAQSRQANPQGCWNWFKASHQKRGRGEPATIAAMTRQVIAEHGVDPARVYVAGLSAGGAMAAILGQAYPDLFAAVGVHSGLAPGAAEDLPGALAAMQGRGGAGGSLAVPTIVFHGDADATVHAANGRSVFEAAPGEHATLHSEVVRDGGAGRSATRHRRSSRDGRVVAEHWVVHGAGHAWSGGQAAGSHTDPSGPDASATMWRFFEAHRKPVPEAGGS